MATYTVTGAGDNSFNGTYTVTGTSNGFDLHSNGTRFLENGGDGLWYFTTIQGNFGSPSVGYYNNAITGAYSNTGPQGTAPAPTVTAAGITIEPDEPELTAQNENSAQGTLVNWDSTWTALYFRYLEKSSWANTAYRSIAPRIPIPDGESWEIQGLVTNVVYTGQFIAVGADGVEVEGSAADFMATPVNRVLFNVVPQIPAGERTANGGPYNGIRYVIEGAGTAAGFSAIVPPAGFNGSGFLMIGNNSSDELLGVNGANLPEPDGDYCVHVILRDADGITERGGGQFIFKPQGMTPTEGTTFEPLFSAEDSGLISGGERVFYDSHFFVGGVVDGVKFFWKHQPLSP